MNRLSVLLCVGGFAALMVACDSSNTSLVSPMSDQGTEIAGGGSHGGGGNGCGGGGNHGGGGSHHGG
ncbi:MAG: hypothetical protein KC488_12205, partial [Candidatus Cloacimonetes bacterium]|nr:hypothetical protein [Candidatus Cloacimonadota bacterium]